MSAADQLQQMINELENDQGLELSGTNTLMVRKIKEWDLTKLMKRKNVTHLIADLTRPGVSVFLTTLEHKHFPPCTPKNEEFELRYYRWQNILWNIVTIPKGMRTTADIIAKESGLRRADGVPTILTGGSSAMFPLRSDNAWHMENVAGHPIYEGGNTDLMRELEQLSAQAAAQGLDINDPEFFDKLKRRGEENDRK